MMPVIPAAILTGFGKVPFSLVTTLNQYTMQIRSHHNGTYCIIKQVHVETGTLMAMPDNSPSGLIPI